MQRVLALLLALCAVSVAHAAICTVSGDPHWNGFDKTLHDFQGSGSFVHVQNNWVQVQANHQPCNPPHAVTCIRSTATKLTRVIGRNFESVTFSWGIFYSPTVDPLVVNGEVVSASACTRGCTAPINATADNAVATFTYNGNTLSIRGLTGVNVTLSRFYLQVGLPDTEQFMGSTIGLCGAFDGDATNDFTYPNGTVAFPSSLNGRFNGPKTNAWAATYAVGTGTFTPLVDQYHRFDHATKTIYKVPSLQAVVIPTDEVQAQLDQVTFADADKVNEIQDKCLALYPAAGVDSHSVRNCVYDATTLPDNFVLAASNQAAQANADAQMGIGAESESGLSKNQIIGLSIGLGLCGLLAVVVAGVLYYRLRKVSIAYQNALIVRSGSTSGATGGMRLKENL